MNAVRTPPVRKRSGFAWFMIIAVPILILLLCVAFYVLFVPILFGYSSSLISWMFAGGDGPQSVGDVASPGFVIVLFVILQYALWGGFAASIYVICREVNGCRYVPTSPVRYTGRIPCSMVGDALNILKNNRAFSNRDAAFELRIAFESLRYSKDFGVAKDEDVYNLENVICDDIDTLTADVSSEDPDVLAGLPESITALKKKIILRDSMLRK